jgi:hypothetical protein
LTVSSARGFARAAKRSFGSPLRLLGAGERGLGTQARGFVPCLRGLRQLRYRISTVRSCVIRGGVLGIVNQLLANFHTVLAFIQLVAVSVHQRLRALQLILALRDQHPVFELVSVDSREFSIEITLLTVEVRLLMIGADLFAVRDALIKVDHGLLLLEVALFAGAWMGWRLSHAATPGVRSIGSGFTGAGRPMW